MTRTAFGAREARVCALALYHNGPVVSVGGWITEGRWVRVGMRC